MSRPRDEDCPEIYGPASRLKGAAVSDQSGGPGWWLASDGKWYPPQPDSLTSETSVMPLDKAPGKESFAR